MNLDFRSVQAIQGARDYELACRASADAVAGTVAQAEPAVVEEPSQAA